MWWKAVFGAQKDNRACASLMAAASGVGSTVVPRGLRGALITVKHTAAGSAVCFPVVRQALKVIPNFVKPMAEGKDVCTKAAGFALKACTAEPIFV